jgi:hypothetical protein
VIVKIKRHNMPDIQKEAEILIDKYMKKIGTKLRCDINSGECENFAYELLEKLGEYNENTCELETRNFVHPDVLPTHVWVFHNGKHYDAEAPQGVDNWFDLPIFKRIFCNK